MSFWRLIVSEEDNERVGGNALILEQSNIERKSIQYLLSEGFSFIIKIKKSSEY